MGILGFDLSINLSTIYHPALPWHIFCCFSPRPRLIASYEEDKQVNYRRTTLTMICRSGAMLWLIYVMRLKQLVVTTTWFATLNQHHLSSLVLGSF